MQVEEAIRHRRSIRHYTNDPVSTVDIREMLAVAGLAPSIANRQMWRYIVVTTPELRQMLADLVRRRLDEMAQWLEFESQPQRLQAWREQTAHLASAPVIILFINLGYRTPLDTILVERGMKAWETAHLFAHPEIQSVSALVSYFTLLAEERGYGACWLTSPLIARKDLQASLELKPGEDITALLTLGRPAETPPPRGRKAVDELIEWR